MKKVFSLIALLTLSACASYPLGMSEAQWNTLSVAQQQTAIAEQQKRDEFARLQYEAARYQQQQVELNAQKERLESNARLRLGITDDEWASMMPEKRLALREEQEHIERESQAIAQASGHNDELASATHDIASAMREDSRRELYTNAAYGSVVDCEINGGKGKFTNGLISSKWSPLMAVRFSVAKGDRRNVAIRRADKQKIDGSFWVGFSESQELEFCADEDTNRRYKRCRTYPVTPAYKENYTTSFSIPSVIDGATLTCHFAPGRV